MKYASIYARVIESESSNLINPDCIKIFCEGPSTASGEAVLNVFQKEALGNRLLVQVVSTGPWGYPDLEPLVLIEKPGWPPILYCRLTPSKAAELIKDFLIENNPRPDLALCCYDSSDIKGISDSRNLPLFGLQKRIALRNVGHLDPENIHHYILLGRGYTGLSRVLNMNPEAVIQALHQSGLRGRGGAGYNTAEKWSLCRNAAATPKYLICNSLDSDPQAKTAGLLMESDPHAVLEGILVAAYAVGASSGILCIDAAHPGAINKLRKALEQMTQLGLLGKHILDSNFSFEIEIREMPVSLVSGEETAVLGFLEQRQAMPSIRPPYPAEKGLGGQPTLVNSAETLAQVSAIFQNSPDWYSATGKDFSRGTKVVTLSGRIAHPYTLEVPFGFTLKSLIDQIGGGVPEGKQVKAVQLGGPAGAYFAASSLDFPVTYETMQEYGSIIGSGTIEVFDSDFCAVEMARDKIAYLHEQSCGKCVFCREGTYQMSDILKDISENRSRPQDLDLLVELGQHMQVGCICNLGRAASNPVLSSLKLFRNEYDSHLKDQKCSVGIQ